MNRFMRELRLVPLVLFATASLLALKIGGLATSGGYMLASPRQAQANDLHQRLGAGQRSWGRGRTAGHLEQHTVVAHAHRG